MKLAVNVYVMNHLQEMSAINALKVSYLTLQLQIATQLTNAKKMEVKKIVMAMVHAMKKI